MLGPAIAVVGIILIVVHVTFAFYVVRDVLLHRLGRATFVGKKPLLNELLTWRKTHKTDAQTLMISTAVVILDAVVLVWCVQEGMLYTMFGMLFAYLTLFFVAYFFHPFERPEEIVPRPFTQSAVLRTLEKGEPVSIMDSWRLRASNEPALHVVHQVEAAEIDPLAKTFSVRLQTRKSTEALVLDRAAQLKFFRSVLDFLFFLIDEDWLRPYRKFYQTVTLEVWGEHLDEIARPIPYRFYRVPASVQKAEEIMMTGWDPFQLDKVFNVTF